VERKKKTAEALPWDFSENAIIWIEATKGKSGNGKRRKNKGVQAHFLHIKGGALQRRQEEKEWKRLMALEVREGGADGKQPEHKKGNLA